MRLNTVQKASVRVLAAGLRCRVPGCGHVIQPGESYTWAKGRYTPRMVHCHQHPNWKRSELTTSKMATVFEAVENAEDSLLSADTLEAIEEILQEVEATRDEVSEEYREAASAFNDQGPSAEAADELDGWDLALSGEDADCEDCAGEGQLASGTDCPTCDGTGVDEDKLQSAREAAQALLDECPG